MATVSAVAYFPLRIGGGCLSEVGNLVRGSVSAGVNFLKFVNFMKLGFEKSESGAGFVVGMIEITL
jgi:hypothetical protein